jgi:hypothetical protein
VDQLASASNGEESMEGRACTFRRPRADLTMTKIRYRPRATSAFWRSLESLCGSGESR